MQTFASYNYQKVSRLENNQAAFFLTLQSKSTIKKTKGVCVQQQRQLKYGE